MQNNFYMPEGRNIRSHENLYYLSSLQSLQRAMYEGRVLEAMALMCDENLNLHVDLNGIEGIIPKDECLLTREGEDPKDIAIITRVGKPVCFKVLSIEEVNDTPRVILSRRAAQIECHNYYITSLSAGDIIPATVTHLDNFGAFVDIGCGIVSLLSIDCISISRISHPSDRLSAGQTLEVVVRSIDDNGRLFVTLKELLGTWQENAAEFTAGRTVSGIVRSIESYGIFVELAPNLAGLAEIKDSNPLLCDIEVGESVSVYIKSILPDRMKIKLVIIDVNHTPAPKTPLKYYISSKIADKIKVWRYSPLTSQRIIESVFE